MIRAGNDYTFNRPILATDRISVTWTLESMVEKPSSRGGTQLFVMSVATYADAQGHTVFGCDTAPMEMTARDALRVATRGGAQVLGRSDIGHLSPGMCADLALFDLGTLGQSGGAVHDPVASLLLGASAQAAYTVVNGRVVVRQGQLATLDAGPVVERHNRLARELVGGSK
jgi:cytosine/adenosine deaminase-related metal-dependent hydrolase